MVSLLTLKQHSLRRFCTSALSSFWAIVSKYLCSVMFIQSIILQRVSYHALSYEGSKVIHSARYGVSLCWKAVTLSKGKPQHDISENRSVDGMSWFITFIRHRGFRFVRDLTFHERFHFWFHDLLHELFWFYRTALLDVSIVKTCQTCVFYPFSWQQTHKNDNVDCFRPSYST